MGKQNGVNEDMAGMSSVAASATKLRQPFGESGARSWVMMVFLMGAMFSLSHALFRMRLELPQVAPGAAAKKDPALYEVLSFGHLPALVDWVWITTLAETELIRPPKGTHSQLFYDLEVLADLDPLFAEIYTVGANLLAVVQDDGLGAKVLLDKGESFRKERLPSMPESYKQSYWAHSWQIPILLGYTHLFELADMPSAAKNFLEAATLPGVPAYVLRLQKRLEQPGGEYEVGMKLLNFLISTTVDPKIREGYEKKRANLFVAQYLHDLNLEWAKFRGAHKAQGIERAWAEFRREARITTTDPWGGTLSIAPGGKIASTTPYEKVFSLD
jgi:hypothetical protein